MNEELDTFTNNFCLAATIQGRIAYFLMSLHAPNPSLLGSFLSLDPYPYLFANMVYGIGILIYSRPSMIVINPFHRFTFSLLGSLMFNHSSVILYNWLRDRFPERPYLATFLGYACGRVMLVHLMAFLYHVDSRTIYPDRRIRRDPEFEDILLGSLMFNNWSCMVFEWLRMNLEKMSLLATVLGFVCGRIFMVNLLLFLYHIDTRIPMPGYQSHINTYYETIYIVPRGMPDESFLLSLMFNQCSCDVFQWINLSFEDSPVRQTILGILIGRCMMLTLFGFFYNLDTRITLVGMRVNRIHAYEFMYIEPRPVG